MNSIKEILKEIASCVEALDTVPQNNFVKCVLDDISKSLPDHLEALSKHTGIDIKILSKMLDDCRKQKVNSIEDCLRSKIAKYKEDLTKKEKNKKTNTPRIKLR